MMPLEKVERAAKAEQRKGIMVDAGGEFWLR